MTKPENDEIENMIATIDRYFNHQIKRDIPLVIQQYIPRLIKYIRLQEQLITSREKRGYEKAKELYYQYHKELENPRLFGLNKALKEVLDEAWGWCDKKYLAEEPGKEGEKK